MKKIVLIFLMLNTVHTYISTAEPINLNISFEELCKILQERSEQHRKKCEQIAAQHKNTTEEVGQKYQDDSQVFQYVAEKKGILCSPEGSNAIGEHQKNRENIAEKLVDTCSWSLEQIRIESQRQDQENLELIRKWIKNKPNK